MKITKQLGVLSILTVLGLVTGLKADQVQTIGNGGTYNGYGPYQSQNGGEFTLKVLEGGSGPDLSGYLHWYSDATSYTSGLASANTFQTFCVEGTEYIYAYPTISDITLTVGNVTVFGNKQLTAGAAYLYYQFATGALDDYNYTGLAADRKASAYDLQKAIWYFMGQETSVASAALTATNTFRLLAEGVFGSVAGALATNASLADPISVQVLSLWQVDHAGEPGGNPPYARQDQLILTGNQGFNTNVPDGGWTVGLLGMGLAGLGLLGRRLRVCA